VKWSILDGIDEGFNMHIIEDAVKGIDLEGSLDDAWKEMKNKGVHVVQSSNLL
jgi:nicotinamidase/pyrazinamidase